jgi:peptidoglycan/LPS O-acetylase OafA/YrhL
LPAYDTKSLITRIDFLRGAFALWVLFAHSFEMSGLLENSHGGLSRWFRTLFMSGYLGVCGFFFISGYCIHWSIEKNLSREGKGSFSYRKYFIARLSRIAPLFYIGLVTAVVVQWTCANFLEPVPYLPLGTATAASALSSIFFVHAIFETYPTYGPSWSITYEAFYYVAWPVLLALSSFNIKRCIIAAVASSFFFTSIFYFAWRVCGDLTWISLATLWGIPLAAFMWIAGAACKTYHDAIVSNWLFTKAKSWWWVILVGWISWSITLQVCDQSLFWRTVLNPFGYIAIPLLVLAPWKTPISGNANHWFADLSYPLYLLHVPLLYLTIFSIHLLSPQLGRITTVSIAAATALIISGTIGVSIERIFLTKKRI